MVNVRESAVDAPEARLLLEEYFGSRELGFAHLERTYTITFPDPATFTPPAGVFLIVSRDGEDGEDAPAPVGCGGIRRIADGAAGIRYEVKHLYLRPETRGRGWGRLLLRELESRAAAWDAAELVLDTHHSLTAAAHLYAGAGFTETEKFNDNPNATRWYAKALR